MPSSLRLQSRQVTTTLRSAVDNKYISWWKRAANLIKTWILVAHNDDSHYADSLQMAKHLQGCHRNRMLEAKTSSSVEKLRISKTLWLFSDPLSYSFGSSSYGVHIKFIQKYVSNICCF